jgi:hypothetical protein
MDYYSWKFLLFLEIPHLGHVPRCPERCLITPRLSGSPAYKSQAPIYLYSGRFRGRGLDCRLICGIGGTYSVRLAPRSRRVTSR